MIDSESATPGGVPVALGQVLADKYRVDRVLGVGGMGVVVAATHLQLDRKVALKFMLAQGVQDRSLVERFSREARAAVRLRSDHVARVLDVGTMDSGSPYIVMEYLDGDDLGSVLDRKGPLPFDVAVDCVLQACDAVAEAHALGIVHRDLKPKNLFLTHRNDGRALVKVLDFGISKQMAPTADFSLTRTTQVLGSPNYMSPEQFRSAKAADERSDIWALGVVLYELIAGQVPFLANSVTELTVMVLTEPPSPLEALRSDVPAELARVIDQCLRKDPAARFQSVAELALALWRFGPPDSQDVAKRISQIGSAPHSLRSGNASAPRNGGATTGSGLSGSEGAKAGAARRWPGQARAALTLALCALALGAGIGAKLVLGPRRASLSAPTPTASPAAAKETATAEPVARANAFAAPEAPANASVAPENRGIPQFESPASAGPIHMAPPRAMGPASGGLRLGTKDAGPRTNGGKRDGAAPAESDESPHYRTNW